jgi:hypothetical protein
LNRVKQGLRSVSPGLAPQALTAAGIKALISLFIVVPALALLASTCARPPVDGIGAIVVATSLWWVIASRDFDERRAKHIIVACVFVFMAIHLFTLFNHITDPHSDFQTQWQTALRYASEGISQPDRPQTQRALPLLYPLAVVFGDRPLAYQLTNLLLSTATMVMATWIARRWWGWSAAAKSAILLTLGIEVYFAKNLPSHDLLGTFGLVTTLLIWVEFEARVERLGRPIAMGLVAGIVTGLVIAWTDWQRSLGLFLMATVAAHTLLAVAQRAKHRVPGIAFGATAIAAALGVGALLGHGHLRAHIAPTHITSTEVNLASYGSYDSDGRRLTKVDRHPLLAALGDDNATRVGPAVALQAVLDAPRVKYGNFLQRSRVLLDLGRSRTWYFRGAHSHRVIAPQALGTLYRAIRVPVVSVLLLALLAACWWVYRRPAAALDIRAAPVVLIGVFLAIMGLVGEAQSRYSQFLFSLIPVYAGCLSLPSPIATWRRRSELIERITRYRPAFNVRLARSCVSYGTVLSLTVAMLWLARAHAVPLINFDNATVRVRVPGDSSWGSASDSVTTTQNVVVLHSSHLMHEGASARISSTVTADSDESVLTFVLESDGAPDARFQLEVLVDDETALDLEITSPLRARAYEVPLASPGRHQIAFLYYPRSETVSADPAGAHRLRIGYAGMY